VKPDDLRWGLEGRIWWAVRCITIIVITTVYHLVTMNRWTGEQRGFAVKTYFQNGESFFQTRRVP